MPVGGQRKRGRDEEMKRTLTVEALEQYLLEHYTTEASEQGLFMKLVEEVGEVAELLNQRAGRKAGGEEDLSQRLVEELADIIHYTVAIAAVNQLDLAEMILQKDEQAAIKYQHRMNLIDYLQKEGDKHG